MSHEGAAGGGLYERVQEAVAAIRSRRPDAAPEVALILGSGLGSFAERFEDATALDYAEIPHFPVSGVEGHVGRLVLGSMAGTPCVTMQGRVHYYEGYPLEVVTFPLRTMLALGARTVIVTNAAGGIGEILAVGDLVLIRDHINLFGSNPLRGPNDDRLGPRFPDMTRAYDPDLRVLAHRVAGGLGLALRDGVYAGVHGPSYETPAEIEMFHRIGADLVGMSTVPEVIVANHMGARVLGISCVTNLAAGKGEATLSHDDVTHTAQRVRQTFEQLVEGILAALDGSR